MIKVSLHSFQYLFGLLFAVLPYKPLKRIAIPLAVIAAVQSLAKRNDICRNSTAVPGDRYPVVKSNSVPKANGASTDSAAIIPVIPAITCFLTSQRIGQFILAGAVSLLLCLYMVRVVTFPLLSSALVFLTVQLSVLAFAFCVSLFACMDLRAVCFTVVATVFVALGFMLGVATPYYGARVFRIYFLRLDRSFISTRLAPRRKSPTIFAPVKLVDRFPAVAVNTQSVRDWLINHVDFPLHTFAVGVWTGAKVNAVHAGHESALVHTEIIPLGGVFCPI